MTFVTKIYCDPQYSVTGLLGEELSRHNTIEQVQQKLENDSNTTTFTQYYITHPHTDISWVHSAINDLAERRKYNERLQRAKLQVESRSTGSES